MRQITVTSRHDRFTPTRLNRRTILLSAGAAAGLSLITSRSFAQEASPPASPAHESHTSAEIPEVELVANPDGLVFPETVSAGLNRVTMINNSDADLHVFTMRIPDDVSEEELAATMSSEGTPDWWESAYFAGNPDQAPAGGGSIVGYVHYEPGRYVIQNPFTGAMTRFEAEGDSWGRSAPVADGEVGLLEFSFLGLDAPLAAGPQTWRVTNHGDMWHDITLFTAPAGSTVDDFFALLMADESVFPPEGYGVAGGVGAMSPGVSTWVELDLAPGIYIGSCFLPMTSGPDINTPHALLGMITTFEVA